MLDAALIFAGIAVLAVGAAAVALVLLRRAQARTIELQRRFGPEYVHTVEALGSLEQAEEELEQRPARGALQFTSRRERAPHFAATWTTSSQIRYGSGVAVKANNG